MAPIPTRQKKNRQQPRQAAVPASDVYDDMGRPLDLLMRRQKRTDRQQREDITINRQHAQQYESDQQKNKLVYRDVFPGRKYKLTLNDTRWMGDENVVRIGYTVDDEFTLISVTAEAPQDNTFEINLDELDLTVIDTLEIQLIGASEKVRGYLEDNTSSGSISQAITRILDSVADLISGQDDLEERIAALERAVGIPYTSQHDLDTRVTDLETP